MPKLLFVDPWAINGLEDYTDNLLSNLQNYDIDIIYLSNFHSNFSNKNILNKHYFKYSEKNKSIFRIFIRFLEYLINQIELLFIAFKIKPNVIHIQWSLFFLYDIFIILILKILLPHTVFVFTLHNIKNHTFNDKYLRYLYIKRFNYFIVHGLNYYNTFINNTDLKNKVILINHGNKISEYFNKSEIPSELISVDTFNKKIFLFFGNLKSNKGLPNLINIFQSPIFNDSLLIIAGKPHYSTNNFFNNTNFNKNIITIKRFVNNNEKKYLFELCDLVLLPYLNGSLSGVLFTAASFKKPCLCTNFGVINDYIIDNKTSFIVDDISCYENKLKYIMNYSKDHLYEIGCNNFYFINSNFNWNKISYDYYKFYNSFFINV